MEICIAVVGVTGTLLGGVVTGWFQLAAGNKASKIAEREWEKNLSEKQRNEILGHCEVLLSFFESEISVLKHRREPRFLEASKEVKELERAVTRLRLIAPQTIVDTVVVVQNYRLLLRSAQAEGTSVESYVDSFVMAVEAFTQVVRKYFVVDDQAAQSEARTRVKEFFANR